MKNDLLSSVYHHAVNQRHQGSILDVENIQVRIVATDTKHDNNCTK